MNAAVSYYQAASESNSKAGEEARRELILLELPGDPDKYIQSGALLGNDGVVYAAIKNSSPVAANAIRLNVEYINANNKLRQFSINVRGTLAAGEQTAVPTKIQDISDVNELARRVRVTVVSARVAEQ